MGRRTLKHELLLAAFELCGGDEGRSFSVEELLVAAWKGNPVAWGLRNFEHLYPDNKRIQMELDRGKRQGEGLLGEGLLERVEKRVYRITALGLASVVQLGPATEGDRQRVDRVLEAELQKILGHEVYGAWLKDPAQPTFFRSAGEFWAIAPGTPPRVIEDRIRSVERTLRAGLMRGFEEVSIERCLTFHNELKHRFSEDLELLGVDV